MPREAPPTLSVLTMKTLIKGPISAAIASFVLLVVIWARVMPGGVEAFDLILSLASLAVASGLLVGLVLAWTGNRIVSLGTGILFVLHPVLAPATAGALPVVASSAAVLAALLARECGHGARADGRGAMAWEGVALLMLALAAIAGPAAAALPPLAALTDLVFRRRVSLPFLILSVGVAAGGIALFHHEGFAGDALAHGPLQAFRDLVMVPEGAVLGALVDVMGAALGAAGIGALILGLPTASRGPRWLLLHFGFATVWFLLCHGLAMLPGTPGGNWGRVLALAGPSLIVPALAWRTMMAVWERGRVNWAAPGVESGAATNPEAPVSIDPADLVHLEAQAEAWRRRQEGWAARFVESEGAEDQRWSGPERSENLFCAFVRPHVTATSRVLEIGPVAPTLTRLLAVEAAEVLCMESSVLLLQEARSELQDLENITFVASDRSDLGVVGGGCLDLIVATDAFVKLSLERIYSCLRDFERVLCPGGRCVLGFANLLDPEGFEAFERQVAVGVVEGATPIQFLTPEIVRTLTSAAGLNLLSLHIAANGRDMLATLERPPGLAS